VFNRGERNRVQNPVGCHEPVVPFQQSAGAEIERGAVQVGYAPARLFDDDAAGRLIPDLVAETRPGRQGTLRPNESK
jgi:hypothetical protein